MPQAYVEYKVTGKGGSSATTSCLVTVGAQSDMSVQREVEKKHPGKTIDIIDITWK